MKGNNKHENYGLYLTLNTYSNEWYCFTREDATKYWNGESCKKAKGATPQKALLNYKAGRFTK
jgi:hypothetical protein